MLNHTPADNAKLHLYVTKTSEPSESDTISTYTAVELVDSLYTASSLIGTLWTVATVTGTTTGTYPRVHFSISTTASVQGLFVSNDATNDLLWAERFDAAPLNIPGGGGVIAIDASIEAA